MQFIKIYICFFTLLLLHGSVYSEVKYALIIGNDAYPDAPLKNSGNDARSVALTLKKLDFQVDLLINKSATDMKHALNKFTEETSKNNAVGVVYFSGHGVQLRDRNLALGVDANFENDLRERSINIQEFLSNIDTTRTTKIVIIDACREYLPPQKEFLTNKEARNGMKVLEPTSGSIIAFSTLPGKVAYDGRSQDANGIYTKALIKYLDTPGLAIETIFKNVRIAVENETNSRQIPMEMSLLTRDFYFNPVISKNLIKLNDYSSKDKNNTSITEEYDNLIISNTSLTKLYSILRQINLDVKANNKSDAAVLLYDIANSMLEKFIGLTLEEYEILEISKNIITVGADFINTPEYIKNYFQLKNGSILTKNVKNTGVAYRSGLREGDLVLGINDKNISNINELIDMSNMMVPGDIISANILRNGFQLKLSAIVERTSIDDLIFYAVDINLINKKYLRAQMLLKVLASRGNTHANSLLANLAYNKLTDNIDNEIAFNFSKKASEGGDTKGDFWRAYAYKNGLGVHKDLAKAHLISSRAAEEDNLWAIAGLGLNYLQGQGVEINYQLAKHYLEKAAFRHHHDGILGLAMIFENGFGVKADAEQALIWYTRALESGNYSVEEIAKRKLRLSNGDLSPIKNIVDIFNNVRKLLQK